MRHGAPLRGFPPFRETRCRIPVMRSPSSVEEATCLADTGEVLCRSGVSRRQREDEVIGSFQEREEQRPVESLPQGFRPGQTHALQAGSGG
jgi:hypothetical protein